MTDTDDSDNLLSVDEGTIVSGRGPYRNGINSVSISHRKRFERNYNQSNMCNLGSSSKSVCSYREPPKTLYNSSNSYGTRSMLNGRSSSPVSMRSTASNISAIDIAHALSSCDFSRNEMRVIKEAFRKLVKKDNRRTIEKRRNKRFNLKAFKPYSGYDSEVQASESSLSSDNTQVSSLGAKSNHLDERNISYSRTNNQIRLTKKNSSDLKRIIRESTMFKDRTNYLKTRSYLRLNNTQDNTLKFSRQTDNRSLHSSHQVGSRKMLKTLPFTIEEDIIDSDEEIIPNNLSRNNLNNKASRNDVISFKSENNTVKRKRGNTIVDDWVTSDKKKPKFYQPKANNNTVVINEAISANNKNPNDFVFAKPELPMRISNKMSTEKLIAKSANSILKEKNFHNQNEILLSNKENSNLNFEVSTDDQTEKEPQLCANMSDRPSFIKRKLYTQSMDVTESKNVSAESPSTNSPQSRNYSALSKERSKTRKLVSTQSCLNKDVIKDDNILNLINQIIPNQSNNKLEINVNETQPKKIHRCNTKIVDKKNNSDKWDVMSLISTHNNSDISDTYTDDEIFPNTTVIKEKQKKLSNQRCKIPVEKKVPQKSNGPLDKINVKHTKEKQNVCNLVEKVNTKPEIKTRNIYTFMNSFWNIEDETDGEDKTGQLKNKNTGICRKDKPVRTSKRNSKYFVEEAEKDLSENIRIGKYESILKESNDKPGILKQVNSVSDSKNNISINNTTQISKKIQELNIKGKKVLNSISHNKYHEVNKEKSVISANSSIISNNSSKLSNEENNTSKSDLSFSLRSYRKKMNNNMFSNNSSDFNDSNLSVRSLRSREIVVSPYFENKRSSKRTNIKTAVVSKKTNKI